MEDVHVDATRQETVFVVPSMVRFKLVMTLDGTEGWSLLGYHSRGSHTVTWAVGQYTHQCTGCRHCCTSCRHRGRHIPGQTESSEQTKREFSSDEVEVARPVHNFKVDWFNPHNASIMGQGQSNMGPGGNKGSKVRRFSCFGRSRIVLSKALALPFSRDIPVLRASTTTG